LHHITVCTTVRLHNNCTIVAPHHCSHPGSFLFVPQFVPVRITIPVCTTDCVHVFAAPKTIVPVCTIVRVRICAEPNTTVPFCTTLCVHVCIHVCTVTVCSTRHTYTSAHVSTCQHTSHRVHVCTKSANKVSSLLQVEEYKPTSTPIDLGVPFTPILSAPSEDRNRTSPFPYGGMRFEFRAVGSSQNVSMVNTVLGSIVAQQFKVCGCLTPGVRVSKPGCGCGTPGKWVAVANHGGLASNTSRPKLIAPHANSSENPNSSQHTQVTTQTHPKLSQRSHSERRRP
jgi:hypothetical protein